MIRPQNVKDSLPQTLAQKIIARAAGKAEVEVGEIEIGSVDLAMIHDSGGPRRVAPILERLGVEVWDPEKMVVVTDHYVPCLLYTSPSPRDQRGSRMPSSA